MIPMKLRRYLSRIKSFLINRLPKRWVHSYIYRKRHGSRWNYRNPETYDEKIHWHIVNTYDRSYGRYADKFLVRDYVKSCGLGRYLVPVYGIYDRFEDIDFSGLPDAFILKATHGSGPDYYDICQDKKAYGKDKARMKFDCGPEA